jgi:hypothetical protein
VERRAAHRGGGRFATAVTDPPCAGF